MKLAQRLTEPSTWAGFGVAAHALGTLLADPKNPMSYMQLFGGLMAAFLPEAAQAQVPPPPAAPGAPTAS